MKLANLLLSTTLVLGSSYSIAAIENTANVSPDNEWNTAHGASLVEFNDGAQLACWYGASSGKSLDAQIFTNYRDSNESWQEAGYQVAVESGERAKLGITDNKIVGDCSLYLDEDESVHLYYNAMVACEDEWQCAQVQYKVSNDRGDSWSSATQITTPGFLIRSKPIAYKNGKILLPIHLEFLIGRSYVCFVEPGQFAFATSCVDTGIEIGDGEFMTGDGQIQPALAYDEANEEIFVYMRDTKKDAVPYSILRKEGLFGLTWKADNGHTNLMNPDSAVELIQDGGDLYLIHNNDSSSRQELTLSKTTTDNPTEFESVMVIDRLDDSDDQLSYASGVIKDGVMKLVYSYDKDFIRYAEINLSDLN